VEQARSLKAAASQAKTPADLLNIESIQSALLTASGVSDKALNYLLPKDKIEAIQGLIVKYLEPAGPSDEIWEQLKKGTLSNAANLTNTDQVASLCGWLCSL
jgi:hypothetical protein